MSPDDFPLIGPWSDDDALEGALLMPFDRQGRVYLQFRDHGAPRHPGKWGFFGGGIEAGEGPLDAVLREFEEEASVRIERSSPRPYLRRLSETGSRLYVFEADLDIAPQDLRIREGGGFGAFLRADLAQLDIIPFCRDALARRLGPF